VDQEHVEVWKVCKTEEMVADLYSTPNAARGQLKREKGRERQCQ